MYPIRMKFMFVLSFLLMSFMPSVLVNAVNTITATPDFEVFYDDALDAKKLDLLNFIEDGQKELDTSKRELDEKISQEECPYFYEKWASVNKSLSSLFEAVVNATTMEELNHCEALIPAVLDNIYGLRNDINAYQTGDIIFEAKTSDGIDMLFQVINDEKQTVRVGAYEHGCISRSASGHVTIPSSVTYRGRRYTVVEIGKNAFSRLDDVTSVAIPDGVLTIEESAFYYMQGLTSIAFLGSVERIGPWTFAACENISEIILPEGLKEVEYDAFRGCKKADKLVLPSTLTKIDVLAFEGCSNLNAIYCNANTPPYMSDSNYPTFSVYTTATLYVPAATKGKYKAAEGWKQFQNIVEKDGEDVDDIITFADANVKSICVENWDTNGDGELSYDEAAAVSDIGGKFSGNKTIKSFDELRYFTGITTVALTNCSSLQSVSFPPSLKELPYGAFRDCSSLTSVGFTDNITSIGDFAFADCIRLTSIFIPKNVQRIGAAAFGWCNLDYISVDEENPIYCSPNNCNAVIDVRNDMLVVATNHTLIPDNVKIIGNRAFAGCEDLQSITLPSGLTDIYEWAFAECSALREIYIPQNVRNIQSGPFASCESLRKIVVDAANTVYDSREDCNGIIETSSNTLIAGIQATKIPNTVTTIGSYAYYNCRNLTSVNIPLSVTHIAKYAFGFNSSLSSITIPKSITSLENQAFYASCLSSIISEIEEPFAIPLMTFDPWGNKDTFFQQDVTLYVPAGTKTLYEATEGWNKFQNIVEREKEPSSVPYIVWCKDNSTLYFLSSNTELKKGGTYDGQIITDVWSGEDVTNTEQNEIVGQFTPPRFTWTTGECTRFVFDKSFETVRVRSTSAWFNSKLESIEGLEYLNTSEVTSMSYMFGSVKLSNLDLSHFDTHKVKYMHSMFEHCSGLTDLDLSHFDTRNVQSMAYMFANCPNLKSIDLSSFDTRNVENMGNMFRESTALTTLDLTNFNTSNVTSMRQMCYGCSNLTSIDMSSFDTGKVTDMWLMFGQCVALKTIYAGDGWSTVNVTDGSGTFGGCTKLVGGRGTAYDENQVDYTYAHIDGGSSNPGYLTDINGLADDNIIFADANVKAICVENWDTNGDGELSESEAAAVTTLGSVFSENNDITKFNELSYFTGLTEIGDNSFYDCPNLQEISFPASITRIGEAAFFGDYALKNVILPEGLARIEHAAFGICRSLTSLHIPKTVTYISNNGMAFRDCTGLTSITVDEQNQVYDSRNRCNAIIEKETLTLVNGCRTTVVPDGIAEIGMGAFYGQYGITTLELPASVKIIGNDAYDGCGFDTLRIPNTVEAIYFAAFWNCHYLTAVILPENTPELGSELFLSKKLSSVYSYNRNPTAIKDDVFDVDWNGTMTTATLYVPAGCKSKYETTDGWERFTNIVEMEPVDIDPLEKGEEVDFGENSELTEETDLGGVIADNMYFNIPNDKGRYEPVEGCIVITSSTSDEDMAAIEGKEFFDKDLMEHFAGFIFKVPAGQGNIRITAETTGDMTLRVKIGDDDPIEKQLDGRRKVSIPYNVSVETLVYVYAGQNASVKGVGPVTASSGELKIYSIEREDLPTDIANVGIGSSDVTIYSLSGQRLTKLQKGVNVISITRPDGTVQTLKMRR